MKEMFFYVIKESDESGIGVRIKRCVVDNIIRFVEKFKIFKLEFEEKVIYMKLWKKIEFFIGDEYFYLVCRVI